MEIVEKAMSTPLDPSILKRALIEFSNMEPEDRNDFAARTVTMIRILDQEEGKKTGDRAWMAMAVEWRLEALSSLQSTPEFRGYSAGQSDDGADWIREDMIELAAVAPLVRIDDHTVTFDAQTFFKVFWMAMRQQETHNSECDGTNIMTYETFQEAQIYSLWIVSYSYFTPYKQL